MKLYYILKKIKDLTSNKLGDIIYKFKLKGFLYSSSYAEGYSRWENHKNPIIIGT